jgi:hypothetical protein
VYKVGDKVVRKWGGEPFLVHIMYEDQWDGTILMDLYLNKVRASDCLLWDVYNSPLYKAMEEGKSPRRGRR